MAKFKFLEWLIIFLDELEHFQFDWDRGNATKNADKHQVETHEAEEIFKERKYLPLGIQISPTTSEEKRYGILGITAKKRYLSVAFTIRDGRIRIISTRQMSKNERRDYDEVYKE